MFHHCLLFSRFWISARPPWWKLSAALKRLRQSGRLRRSDFVRCSELWPRWRPRKKTLSVRLRGWRRTKLHWGTRWTRSAAVSLVCHWSELELILEHLDFQIESLGFDSNIHTNCKTPLFGRSKYPYRYTATWTFSFETTMLNQGLHKQSPGFQHSLC